MVEITDSDEKERKNEMKYLTYAINGVNGAIFILEIIRLAANVCGNDDKSIFRYQTSIMCYKGLNFLFLAAPIYTGVRGLIASLKKESHYNACCLTCMCKFSMVCMLIMMVIEGTVFNVYYYSFDRRYWKEKRYWVGTKSQLRIYAAAGSFAFLNFVLLTAYSIYMYFEERIRRNKANDTNCHKDVYQKYEKITLRLLACALLVISTILYGLDMRMNVTPSCEHLHPIVKLTYWDGCNGFYNEFSFVCGQGIICAIVGVVIAYYIVFAVLRNLTFEKVRFLKALGIFAVVCMFILMLISSINAYYASYDVEKHSVCVTSAVFAGLNFVLMICIIRIAGSLTERCASQCKPDVEETNQAEANLYENIVK